MVEPLRTSNLTEVRNQIVEQLRILRAFPAGDLDSEIGRANAMNELAKSIVSCTQLELQYHLAAGICCIPFIEPSLVQPLLKNVSGHDKDNLELNPGDADLDSFPARLMWAMRKAKKTNQSALAREVGVTPQSIQYLCDTKNRANGSEHVTVLAKALNVSSIWLATGQTASDPLPPKRPKRAI